MADEAALRQLVDMGIPAGRAKAALVRTKGDVMSAAVSGFDDGLIVLMWGCRKGCLVVILMMYHLMTRIRRGSCLIRLYVQSEMSAEIS